jgi:hypothetical protein
VCGPAINQNKKSVSSLSCFTDKWKMTSRLRALDLKAAPFGPEIDIFQSAASEFSRRDAFTPAGDPLIKNAMISALRFKS